MQNHLFMPINIKIPFEGMEINQIKLFFIKPLHSHIQLFYQCLQSYLKQQSLRKEMNNIKTGEKDMDDHFNNFDSFQEQQSQYRLPQAENKNNSMSIRARKQRQRRNRLLFNQSTWTLQENILYKQFLKQNQNLFEQDQNRARKLMKINVLMSQHVKSRSSDQCRSHHQKMKKNHSDLLSIIRYIEDQEKGVVEQKIEREEPVQQQEITSIEQPQLSREILMNVPLQENQKIWEFVEKQVWYDYIDL